MSDIEFAVDALVNCMLNNHPIYIALLAVIYYDRQDLPPRPDYSKGTFKRAIKRMRELQSSHPKLSDDFEGAIDFIRREWMTNNTI